MVVIVVAVLLCVNLQQPDSLICEEIVCTMFVRLTDACSEKPCKELGKLVGHGNG